MNGTYYPNPTFPTNMGNYPETGNDVNTSLPLPMEQSYIENILRLNRGKQVKVFAAFPDSNDWRDRMFDGIIEDAGKDHLIMSSPSTGDWYLIPLIYVNWVESEEKINFTKIY